MIMQSRYLFTSKNCVFNMGCIWPSPKVCDFQKKYLSVCPLLVFLMIMQSRYSHQKTESSTNSCQFGCYIFLMVKTYCKIVDGETYWSNREGKVIINYHFDFKPGIHQIQQTNKQTLAFVFGPREYISGQKSKTTKLFYTFHLITLLVFFSFHLGI